MQNLDKRDDKPCLSIRLLEVVFRRQINSISGDELTLHYELTPSVTEPVIDNHCRATQ